MLTGGVFLPLESLGGRAGAGAGVVVGAGLDKGWTGCADPAALYPLLKPGLTGSG